MKKRLTIGIGLLSLFVFLATFLFGASLSSISKGFWKDIIPFTGIAIALMLVMCSRNSCCRSKRIC